MKRRSIPAIVLAVALAALAWRLWEAHPGTAVPHKAGEPATANGAATAASGPIPVAAVPQPGAPEEPSHLADALNSPTSDIHADLRAINDIFLAYRSALHASNPIGSNAEITAALSGRNRLGEAFIPKTCPAISPKGELCDRWGTPFFFHQLSGEDMEIRSAGPDRKLWTADDEVLTPGPNPPHL